jgi:hypothetical protein
MRTKLFIGASVLSLLLLGLGVLCEGAAPGCFGVLFGGVQ